MARLFLTPIDLNKLELLNARIQQLASDPGSPVTGQIYYNTAANELRFYNGSAWIDLGRLDQISAPTASVSMNSQKITSLADPTSAQEAATKNYVDTRSISTFAVPTADVPWNSKKITGLLDPTNAQDAATKNYVDTVTNGLSWLESVRVATTANGTLASSFANGQTVDGVTLATGDRILIKNQSTGSENGIYTVNASGAPTRATDADTQTDILQAAMFVQEGTTNADTAWVLSTNAPITVGTTALVFTQFGAGASYTAGTGISISSNVISIENSGVLLVTHGGTGAATLTDHGVIVGSGTGALSATSVGTTGQVLRGQTGADPVFGQAVLTTDVTGILPVANGGSGASSLTDHGVMLGSGTAAVSVTAVGTTGQLLRGQTGADPVFGQAVLTTDVTGTLPVANGGTGGASTAAAKSSLGYMTRYAASYGDGTTTSYTITHNLGTLDVQAAVFRNSDGVEVEVDITHATTNTLTIAHAVAPTSNQYRVVVIG